MVDLYFKSLVSCSRRMVGLSCIFPIGSMMLGKLELIVGGGGGR